MMVQQQFQINKDRMNREVLNWNVALVMSAMSIGLVNAAHVITEEPLSRGQQWKLERVVVFWPIHDRDLEERLERQCEFSRGALVGHPP